MQVAQEIIRQIKVLDKWALGSWAANQMIAHENGIQFETKGYKKGRYNLRVMIKLNGLDLYDVSVGYVDMKKLEWVEVNNESNIYNDMLVKTIDSLLNNR